MTAREGKPMKEDGISRATRRPLDSDDLHHANDPRDAIAADEWEIVRRVGLLAKELRKAKREYFADDTETLQAITPFDMVAMKLEELTTP